MPNLVSLCPSVFRGTFENIRISKKNLISKKSKSKILEIRKFSGLVIKIDTSDGNNKLVCADILSCLSMVMSETRECLKFRLEGSDEDIGLWGHEYIRHLAGEVAAEWNDKITENPEYDTR